MQEMSMKYRVMKIGFCGLLAVILFVAAGCDNQGNSVAESELATDEVSVVLATVNGDEITEEDVHNTIERTFSEADKLFVNEEIATKVLESLIASKAMTQKIKSEMSQDEIKLIQSKVRAYEEELYVKEYLVSNATPEPVTVEMVETYYQNNPEKFGAKTIKEFEQLVVERQLRQTERDALLSDAPTIQAEVNWQKIVDEAKEKYPLLLKHGYASQGLLDPEYDNVLNGLSAGDAAKIFFVDGSPVFLRVIAERQTPAKPLHEVSAEIRKTLAPIQLRKAVKQATDEVVAQAEVKRIQN